LTGATTRVSYGKRCRSVLGPKCPGAEVSRHRCT